ncbi:hypothetical protein [Limnohabitans sp. T6-5]|uniref:hypothetical protein n=1 Tax=Limnohabitans sp. T6-5 TaxID=1100724 RepID=UPI0011B27DDA|nr:hypothetical protein [Limnohabitans sp. T6-5]
MNAPALQTLDLPKKKGVYWKPANALELAYGLGDLERSPETLMNASFYKLPLNFVPRFVPRFGLCYPPFSGHHRSINTRPKSGHKKRVVSFMHQAGKHTPGEQGGGLKAYTLPGHALTVHRSPFPKLAR